MIRKKLYIFLVPLLLITACQKELDEITPIDTDTIITIDNTLFELVAKVSLLDGSFDDILDDASCVSIKLPVTLMLDTATITIESEEDFAILENIMKLAQLDPGDIVFEYPITIVLPDYSTVEINNEDQLEEYTDICPEDGSDDDIECLDFKYPVKISVFNSQNEVADVVTIEDDMELAIFLSTLDSDDLIGLQFPVVMILFDGIEREINDNNELSNLIDDVKDLCEENDDFDLGDISDSELIQKLINDSWVITMLYVEENLTSGFQEKTFEFGIDGLVSANGSVGTWTTIGDGGELFLELDFDSGLPFENIDQEWNVVSFSSTHIFLVDEGVGDQPSEYLVFEREPKQTDSDLEAILKNGDWEVAEYLEGDTDETAEFAGYIVEFDSEEIVTASDGGDDVQGNWNSILDEVLIFHFDESVFELFNHHWEVINISDNEVVLETEEHRLVLQKI